MTGENQVPTIRSADPRRVAVPETPENREETQVLDSGMFIASVDQEAETRAVAPVVTQPGSSRSWVIAIVLLIVLGVTLGALGGLYVTQTRKAAEAQRQADEAARRDAEARAAAEVAKLNQPAVVPVPNELKPVETPLPSVDDAAKAAADKLATDKAAAEKAAAEKAAAEKAEADRLAAEKVAAEQARVAAEKPTPLPTEKELADKAAAFKAAAEQASKAEKLAAEKAAADKAAADKAAADKAAAEKIAAEKPDKTTVVAAVSTKTTPAGEVSCPEGMVMLRAGAFRMGTPADDPMKSFDERGLTRVDVAAVCVDTFEFPNKRGVAPQVAISFGDAQKACQAVSKRLCTEQEWEKACKGPANDKWPYGSTFNYDSCNTEDEAGDARTLASAGKFAKCRSPFGVFDLAGNVAEWTADRTIKGGSYASADYAVRCSARKNGGSVSKSSEVGFRCCADPQ